MTRTFPVSLKRLAQGLLLLILAFWAAPVQAQVFWTDVNDGAIGIASASGTVYSTSGSPWITLTGTLTPNPIGIATDGTASVIWADFNNGTIGRADYPGTFTSTIPTATNVNVSWISGITNPTGVAIYGGYVYWTSGDGYIGRAPIPATVTDTPTPDLTWFKPTAAPTGLRIVDGVIYWTNKGTWNGSGYDNGTGSIWSTPLIASPVDPTVATVTGCSLPTDVDVKGTNIYWANNNTGSIGHVDTSVGTVDQSYKSGLTYAESICAANNLYISSDYNIYVAGYSVDTNVFFISVAPGGGFLGITAVNDIATVISLTSFTATPKAAAVTLAWTTGSEVNTAGFNILRSSTINGTYTKVNSAIIPATGTNVAGASYSYTDSSVTAGATYYYELQDIDTANVSTFHGPISATVATGSLISSFQATPTSIFLGGGSLLSWTVTGSPVLSLNSATVSGSSLWVTPTTSMSYTLSDTQGDANLVTVSVKSFSLEDMAGLCKAWGTATGDSAFDASYDLNGDGKVDDTDVALCFKGL